jgi:DNA mismatch repair protein MutS
MAGKTTVMREVAIIQFLAQLGSFVPAKEATLSLCDRLFSRLGANDDILHGQSTFMVEMSETAQILRHATDKSLIILDEVGRGTSTYDGLSIAWALVEHFVRETKAFTLFSTHYHELIEVVDDLKGASNFTVKTKSENGQVQFLYQLIEEGATQSYGIYVAQLAGLPRTILHRSQKILKGLEDQPAEEQTKQTQLDSTQSKQLSFFEMEEIGPIVPEYLRSLESEIIKLDPLNMTPIEALQKLQSLKESYLQ